MASTVSVIIAGLCTILNVRDDTLKMPPPSVIVVKTGQAFGHTGKHIPFIAWDTTKVKADFSVASDFDEDEVEDAPNFKYFTLTGERFEIDGDADGPPDATEFHGIASYTRYRREPVPTEWDPCYIPDRNDRPSKKCVHGFWRFGGGVLTTARPTEKDYVFEDDQGKTALVAAKYRQEVIYTTASKVNGQGKPYVVIKFRSLDHDATVTRSVTFTSLSTASLQLFLGNALVGDMSHVVNRMNETDPKANKSLHFHALAKAVKDHTDMAIPVLDPPLNNPANPSGPGGGDSGYCGPESKP